LDIIASAYGRVHSGHFDSVIVYNSNSTVDTTLTVNNVLIHHNATNIWHGIGHNISDTVNVVLDVGGALIFGGTCSNQSGSSNVCLSRYLNSVLQPLFLNDSGIEDYSVHTIAYESGNEFTFGGNFEVQPMVGTYGSHLATYNLITNLVEAIASLDQSVNSVSFLNGDLYLGGSFQTNLSIHSINYLGRIVSTVGINESVSEINRNFYPNPFNTTMKLDGIENGIPFSILNIDGRTVKSGTVLNEKINDLDFLPKGTYLLLLETAEGSISKKIFK